MLGNTCQHTAWPQIRSVPNYPHQLNPQPPTTATPATPYLNPEGDTNILYLPILPWQDDPPGPEDPDLSEMDSNDKTIDPNPILNQLMTPPTLWESKLWYHILCHSKHDNLNQAILARIPVIACSDAVVDAAKFSTFSWIFYSNQVLWQGKGIVRGLADNIYSSQSEAFGIHTTLWFLSNYLLHYPNAYQNSPIIMIYCNSQGVLDCIQKLHNAHTIQVCSTTDDDYNIYSAI